MYHQGKQAKLVIELQRKGLKVKHWYYKKEAIKKSVFFYEQISYIYIFKIPYVIWYIIHELYKKKIVCKIDVRNFIHSKNPYVTLHMKLFVNNRICRKLHTNINCM